ncbi:MAG: hypothetical protein ACREUF_06265 [Solimonas sp.]
MSPDPRTVTVPVAAILMMVAPAQDRGLYLVVFWDPRTGQVRGLWTRPEREPA